MDRNTIIGIVLIFGILVGYSLWNRPSEEEKLAAQHRQDSIAAVQNTKRVEDSIRNALETEMQVLDTNTQQQTFTENQSIINQDDTNTISNIDVDKHGLFAAASLGENKTYSFENELIKLSISAQGGKIITTEILPFQTYDSLPLILFDSQKTEFGLTFFMNNRLVNTENYYFLPYLNNHPLTDQKNISLGNDEEATLSFRLHTNHSDGSINEQSYVEYSYTLKKEDYMLDFDINFVGMDTYLDRGLNYVDLHWKTELLKLEKNKDRFNGPTLYYKHFEDDVDYLSETKDDEEDIPTKMKWITFKQRFFNSTLVAKDHFLNTKIKVVTKEEQHDKYLRSMESVIGLPYTSGQDNNIPMSFYFGPSKYKILKKYDLDFERQIPLGWSFFVMAWINRYAVIPVFNYLEGFGWNYGLIILVLTILLKIVLFPIAYKSYKSSAKMRVLKPDIEKVTAKFTKKEDAMKKQKATMDLYKKAGVNPAAGCVPMLLQFPILLAMFRFFPSAFELRQQAFLWADDLSSYDSIFAWTAEIPILSTVYGNHISLFTILMTITTVMYTRVNQEMMGASSQQLPGMKTMMYLMPIMFLGIFNNYASGLSYYYFLANLITFGQMFLIRMTINEGKIRKQIERNKKKPTKKKSSWQKRLEEAAKQRGK